MELRGRIESAADAIAAKLGQGLSVRFTFARALAAHIVSQMSSQNATPAMGTCRFAAHPNGVPIPESQHGRYGTGRPYKPAIDHDRAVGIIVDGDGRIRPEHFDPEPLQIFRADAEKFARIFARLAD